MARYFLDVHQNGRVTRDEEGQEIADMAAVRREAMAVLPEIADAELASDGDNQTFVVVVRRRDGVPVYTSTLSYVGLCLVPDEKGLAD